MEQRSLRLGDIVDDYCPRERRITNHAIVAVVENAIRQTRCTTCDHEHQYKQAREPRRRTKKSEETLFRAVLSAVSGPPPPASRVVDEVDDDEVADAPQAEPAPVPIVTTPVAVPPPPPSGDDTWPVHRTLIRATLPKIEGEQPPPRPIPEFTMHQRPPQRGRGGFRVQHGQSNDPFGPPRDGRRGANGNGHRQDAARNGNVAQPDNGNGPGQGRRRRRRRGKRSGH